MQFRLQERHKETKMCSQRSSARRTQHLWRTLNSPQKTSRGMRRTIQPGIGSFPESSKAVAKSLCKACLCVFIAPQFFVTQSPRGVIYFACVLYHKLVDKAQNYSNPTDEVSLQVWLYVYFLFFTKPLKLNHNKTVTCGTNEAETTTIENQIPWQQVKYKTTATLNKIWNPAGFSESWDWSFFISLVTVSGLNTDTGH